jgi:hypothetical protein
MATKHTECNTCAAVYKLKHDLDPDYYRAEHCAFCGAEIEDEETFDQEDLEE